MLGWFIKHKKKKNQRKGIICCMRCMNILHFREQFWGFCYSGILWAILTYTIDVYKWLPLLSETIMLLNEKQEKVEKTTNLGPDLGPASTSSAFSVSASYRKTRGPQDTQPYAWSFIIFFSSQGHRLTKGEKIPQTPPQMSYSEEIFGQWLHNIIVAIWIKGSEISMQNKSNLNLKFEINFTLSKSEFCMILFCNFH